MKSQSLFYTLTLLYLLILALQLPIQKQATAITLITQAASEVVNSQVEVTSNLEQPSQPSIITQTYLLIKLSKRRVYLYRDGKLQSSYPIAIGKAGWETPTGVFEIIDIQRNPFWRNPFTGKIIPAGSKNPLGAAWIAFWTDGTNQIGFHGTPNERLIGQAVSHGCVRMRNRDILKLYEQVTIGMSVKVIP